MSNVANCENLEISSDFCNHYCDRYYYCEPPLDRCIFVDCKYCKNNKFEGTNCANYLLIGGDEECK